MPNTKFLSLKFLCFMAHVRQSSQNLLKHQMSWISLRIHQSLQPGHHLSAVYKKSYFYIQLTSYYDLSKCNEKKQTNKKRGYPLILVIFYAVRSLNRAIQYGSRQPYVVIKMFWKYKVHNRFWVQKKSVKTSQSFLLQ